MTPRTQLRASKWNRSVILIDKIKNYFYYLCEHYGSKVSVWAWQKRWNKQNRKRYKHG